LFYFRARQNPVAARPAEPAHPKMVWKMDEVVYAVQAGGGSAAVADNPEGSKRQERVVVVGQVAQAPVR